MTAMQLIMEQQRFATVMWGGFDFIADAGGADPARQEWLMECTGLQVSPCVHIQGALGLWPSFTTSGILADNSYVMRAT